MSLKGRLSKAETAAGIYCPRCNGRMERRVATKDTDGIDPAAFRAFMRDVLFSQFSEGERADTLAQLLADCGVEMPTGKPIPLTEEARLQEACELLDRARERAATQPAGLPRSGG